MPSITLAIRPRGILLKILVRAHSDSPAEVAGPVAAYLDTGARDTVVDHEFITGRGLRSERSAALHVLGRDGVSFHEAFDVELAVAVPGLEPRWQPLTVLAGPVFQTGAVAALGRDFLRGVTFTCDGPRQQGDADLVRSQARPSHAIAAVSKKEKVGGWLGGFIALGAWRSRMAP